jgi:hypothetical protein
MIKSITQSSFSWNFIDERTIACFDLFLGIDFRVLGVGFEDTNT